MNENNLIKPIDSIEKVTRDKHEKNLPLIEKKSSNGEEFDALLKYEQERLKEIDRILKEKKRFNLIAKEIYEREKCNNEGIRSSHLNGK